METRLLFTHALSSLHAGTGQGIGVIDLPIAREKATALPFLPGSSVKGTSRDSYLALKAKELNDLEKAKEATTKYFGPEAGDNAAEFASALQFSDQRLLLLPVRSLVGTFAWITSPYILKRFKRDALDAGRASFGLNIPTVSSLQQCLVTNPSTGKTSAIAKVGKVFLEDLDLTADDKSNDAAAWADAIAKNVSSSDQDFLKERFCVVSDDVMSFLVETATEVSARIHLDDNAKTVADGGLWYEEALPCETVLYGLVMATEIKASGAIPTVAMDEVEKLITKPVQFGGKATVGRGVCRLYLN
jgi:CRISPR-associated protein Cmr4